MKVLLTFFFMYLPTLFGVEINDSTYQKIYGEPFYATQDVEGTLYFDLSTVDPSIRVIFILPVKIECKKDTIIIKQGYKKF